VLKWRSRDPRFAIGRFGGCDAGVLSHNPIFAEGYIREDYRARRAGACIRWHGVWSCATVGGCEAVKAGRRRRWVTEGRQRIAHDKQNRTVHNGQGHRGIKDKSAPRSGGGVEMKSGCGLWTAPDQLQLGVASS
jgi:hypothetical protein